MSSGDKGNDPFPFTLDKAKAILALPVVAATMKRRYRVEDHQWDIPYLAGYNVYGSIVYIDRDLKPWPYKARSITCRRFLEVHEHVEKSLIDAIQEGEQDKWVLLRMLRMFQGPDDELYYHCHGVATAIEEHAVRLEFGADGLTSYNAFMKTQIKSAEDKRITRVPASLDMMPYQGSDPMDERLRRVMEEHMVAA